MILSWVICIAILGHRLDTLGLNDGIQDLWLKPDAIIGETFGDHGEGGSVFCM